ncbi:MAG: response regulator transcription factor [Alphaproteobacteria bacterium]|nr:response regulator transcription factor [Alphaproteobacteria bacterium]
MTGRILIVEDDLSFATSLVRSLERRGYEAQHASSTEAAIIRIADWMPDYAVVDLRMEGASGLECVRQFHAAHPSMRIVVLTGYASITTAVEAIKLGACQYLTKPANTDDIITALNAQAEGNTAVAIETRKTSLKNLEWERIHETLAEVDFNISEAARRLGMHRRTLARKLAKQPVR